MHNCQFIVGWHTESGEDGDPIFCDKPASIKYVCGINDQHSVWFCAEHYDEVSLTAKQHRRLDKVYEDY